MELIIFVVWFVMTALLIYIAKSTESHNLIIVVGIFGILFSSYLFLSPNINVTSCFDTTHTAVISGNTTTYTNEVLCSTQTYGTTVYLALIWLLINLILIYDGMTIKKYEDTEE